MKYENVLEAFKTHCFHLSDKSLHEIAEWTRYTNGKNFFLIHGNINLIERAFHNPKLYMPVDERTFKLICELSYCHDYGDGMVIINDNHWTKIINQIKLYESI